MSFFGKVSKFFQHLWSHAPSWSESISTGITLLQPLISTAVDLIAPGSGSDATKVISEIKSGLTAVKTFVAEAHGTSDPSLIASIESTLTAVNDNVASLLTLSHVKDPELVSKVTLAVSAVTGEVNAILSVLPKAA